MNHWKNFSFVGAHFTYVVANKKNGVAGSLSLLRSCMQSISKERENQLCNSKQK